MGVDMGWMVCHFLMVEFGGWKKSPAANLVLKKNRRGKGIFKEREFSGPKSSNIKFCWSQR